MDSVDQELREKLEYSRIRVKNLYYTQAINYFVLACSLGAAMLAVPIFSGKYYLFALIGIGIILLFARLCQYHWNEARKMKVTRK